MPDQASTFLQPLSLWAEQFQRWLPTLVTALLILLISVYLARLARRTIKLAAERRAAGAKLAPMLTSLAYWAVILTGVTVALQQVGVNLTAIIAGLGIAGFTIGFALQDVSKNFVSGMLLLLEKPFQIGDAIEVAGYSGTITAVDLRATELRTFDGVIVLIPNAEVFTKPIANLNRSGTRRIDLDLRVAYHSDLETVRTTALNAISSLPGMLAAPVPQVLFRQFGSSAIDLCIQYWIDTRQNDAASAQDAGLVRVHTAFQENRIEIPLPTQNVQVLQS